MASGEEARGVTSVSDDLNRRQSATYLLKQERAKMRWTSGLSGGSHSWPWPGRPEFMSCLSLAGQLPWKPKGLWCVKESLRDAKGRHRIKTASRRESC